jgi:hypothetical protein
MTGPSGPWALQVDEVTSLASLEISVDSDVKFRDSWTAAVMGSATYGDRVVRVLDPNCLYRLAEQALQDSSASTAQRYEAILEPTVGHSDETTTRR